MHGEVTEGPNREGHENLTGWRILGGEGSNRKAGRGEMVLLSGEVGENRHDYEARAAASAPPAPFALLQIRERQCVPPPFDPELDERLQAERIACSWFSSTRKSWGV